MEREDQIMLAIAMVVFLGFIGAMTYIVHVANEDRDRRVIQTKLDKKKCIDDGGKMIEYHGGSAFMHDWSCEKGK